jgi:hypothetical protein
VLCQNRPFSNARGVPTGPFDHLIPPLLPGLNAKRCHPCKVQGKSEVGREANSANTVENDPRATSASPNDDVFYRRFEDHARWREGNPYDVITLAEINQPRASRRASARKQETIWRP